MITSGDSANLVKIADNLKGLTDNALEREKQNPNGFAPVYMIVSEQSRRKKLRDKYPGDPQTTVAQDLSMASQAYQGKDVLTGIMAGGQPPMMQQPQMAAYGGLMGYNQGGIVGYSDGRLVGFEDDEIQEILKGNLPPRTIASGQGRQRITNPKYQQAVDYLASERARLGDTRNVGSDPSASVFGIGQQNPLPQVKGDKVGRTQTTSTNPEFGSEFSGLKPPKEEKGFFQKMIDAYKGLGKNEEVKPEVKPGKPKAQPKPIDVSAIKVPKQEQIKPNPFAELLKQEYDFSKKAYEDAQARKSEAGRLAAIMGGLTLAGTGNLAQAGIAGLDAFQGEKDKRRNQLAQLAKQRSDATRGYASGMLDLEKLNVSRADLKRKQQADLAKAKEDRRKTKSQEEKNRITAATEIMKNTGVDYSVAMNLVRDYEAQALSGRAFSNADVSTLGI